MGEHPLRTSHDRRVTPARADLAAAHLDGLIPAPRYVEATPHIVAAAVAALYRAPAATAPRETELLYGEAFNLYDAADGWGWGQAAFDGYVGYVALEALGPCLTTPPTHRVCALRTWRYQAPDIKSPVLGPVSLNSLIFGQPAPPEREGSDFICERAGGYIIARHLEPLAASPVALPAGSPALHSAVPPAVFPVAPGGTGLTRDLKTQCTAAQDFVAIAEQFLGTPYLWGGRSSLGLDCSALLQNAFAATGVAIPRDTDQQRRFWRQWDGAEPLYDIAAAADAAADAAAAAELGAAEMGVAGASSGPERSGRPKANDTPQNRGANSLRSESFKCAHWRDLSLKRGDLLCWAGHTAVMTGDTHMLHANATHMAVSCDDARAFTGEVASEAGDLVAIFRPCA